MLPRYLLTFKNPIRDSVIDEGKRKLPSLSVSLSSFPFVFFLILSD